MTFLPGTLRGERLETEQVGHRCRENGIPRNKLPEISGYVLKSSQLAHTPRSGHLDDRFLLRRQRPNARLVDDHA